MRLSNSEWQIMNVLWSRSPRSVRGVLEALEDRTGWAYSTVKTMLTRLADKGAAEVRRRGNAYLYSPAVSREAARRSALRALVDRAFDGTVGTLVHHLVDTRRLDEDERRQLGELLAAAGDPDDRDDER